MAGISSPGPESDFVRITVAGSAQWSFPPQRCTVHLRVAHDGPAKAPVQEATARQLAELQQQVAQLHNLDSGPVTWWSADQIYYSQHRPYNNQGKQLPLVYSCSAVLAVKFSDLGLVAEFAGAAAERDGVAIERLDWALTQAARDEQLVGVRDAAVRDAVAKATAYASSLDLQTVRAVELSEPGLRRPPPEAPAFRAAAMVAGSAAPQVELRPQDIDISAAIEAVFVAR